MGSVKVAIDASDASLLPRTREHGRRPLPLILLGIGQGVYFSSSARISVSEVAACAALLFTVPRFAQLKHGKLLLGTAAVSIAATGFSGWHSDDSMAEVVKAAAGTLVVVAMVLLLVWLWGEETSRGDLRLAVGAYCLGQVLGYALHPTMLEVADPWRYVLGAPALIGIILILDIVHRRFNAPLLIFVASIVVVLFLFSTGVRSLGVQAAAIGLCLLVYRRRHVAPEKRMSKRKLAALLLVGAAALNGAYAVANERGILGAHAHQRYTQQTGEFGVIVGGRKDNVFMAAAISARPVVGWGPDARVPVEVRGQAVAWLRSHDYAWSEADWRAWILPKKLTVHSVLLGSWVMAGVFGFIFWLVVSLKIASAWKQFLTSGELTALIICTIALWHLAFSPLGDVTRGILALALAMTFIQLRRADQGHAGAASTQGVEESPLQ